MGGATLEAEVCVFLIVASAQDVGSGFENESTVALKFGM